MNAEPDKFRLIQSDDQGTTLMFEDLLSREKKGASYPVYDKSTGTLNFFKIGSLKEDVKADEDLKKLLDLQKSNSGG